MAKASGKKLVIVESPTKAKTIRKFLGRDFVVDSCMGHIRDLAEPKNLPEKLKKDPKWSKFAVNTDTFEPYYVVNERKHKVVKDLRQKLEDADELYLATDEDREGESISWHLLEVLKPQVPVKRMVFNEITKEAIQGALSETRQIDKHLVEAQEARRVLDRMVGYGISPLLWKKIAFGLSAGRVQSVAVKLVAERELDRMKFKRSEYWGMTGFHNKEAIDFESRLVSYQGRRVALGKDFDPLTGQLVVEKGSDAPLHLDQAKAQSIAAELAKATWTVTDIEEKPQFRKPAAPFITSTLQQEASRKLGWGAKRSMQVAQKLYENGHITYMRTDSTFLSTQAIDAARAAILKLYGREFLPAAPREYTGKKVKGAQEAHEAIRPAGQEFVTPDQTGLKEDEFKLYDLIWKRTMASQMVDSRQKQVSVRIRAGDAQLTTSGMTIEFPGFLRAYVEGSDDPDAALEDREKQLPSLTKNETLKVQKVEPTQHETKPQARFTEASLIQTMEKEGVGRPSTYASIMETIQDRGYVKKVGTALVPTFTGLIVNKLMSQHFAQFVDLGFTSEMEQRLDEIASGEFEMERYLKEFYKGSKGLDHLLSTRDKLIDPQEARSIHFEHLNGFEFRVGRFGAYVTRPTKKGEEESASIPDNQAPADLTPALIEQFIEQKKAGADAIGTDPVTGLKVYALSGRYGPYVQLGESDGDGAKPKRVSIPANVKMEEVNLAKALDLLSLPKTLGVHPQTQKEVKAGIGRFGPYIVHDGDYRSVPKTESVFEVNLERALQLLAEPKRGRGGTPVTPLKELGPHPQTQDPIQVLNGRYGPYVKCGKTNVTLPEDQKPEALTLEQALALLSTKMKVKGKPAARKPAAASGTAKPKAKPKAARKPIVQNFPEIVTGNKPVAKPTTKLKKTQVRS